MRIEFFLSKFDRNRLSESDIIETTNLPTIKKLRPLLRDLHKDRITLFKYGKFFTSGFERFCSLNRLWNKSNLTDAGLFHSFKVLYTKSIDCYHIIVLE